MIVYGEGGGQKLAGHASDLFVENLSRFIGDALMVKGVTTKVCDLLATDNKTLKRYTDVRPPRGLRDLGMCYSIARALGYSPVSVFSAAHETNNLKMMALMAQSAVDLRLSPELRRFVMTKAGGAAIDESACSSVRASGEDQGDAIWRDSGVFVDRVMGLIGHGLKRIGAVTHVCRVVNIPRSTLQRYARPTSAKGHRDLWTTHAILSALGFDPVSAFSATNHALPPNLLALLAESGVDHTLSPALADLVVK